MEGVSDGPRAVKVDAPGGGHRLEEGVEATVAPCGHLFAFCLECHGLTGLDRRCFGYDLITTQKR